MLLRRRALLLNSNGSPMPEGSYWIDNNGLKFVVLADNTTVEVSSGGGSWANGLYIPGQVSDAKMTTYDSSGTQIPCGNYTYNVVSVAQDGFNPKDISTYLELGDGIQKVKARGFRYSGYNTNGSIWIKFPDSVTSVGDGATTRFNKLTKIKFGCPTYLPGYSISSDATNLRLVVINSTSFQFMQNSFRPSTSFTNHELNLVFPNLTSVPTRPASYTNPFGSPTSAISIYLPDSLVTEAKASWLGGTTYGVGADYIYGLSTYTIDANHPDYNF